MDGDPDFDLEYFYADYPRVESDFAAALEESLEPRGPDLLLALVDDLPLPAAATILDVGCGEGRHALALAARFGSAVHGIDPVPRHLDVAGAALAAAAVGDPTLAGRVSFRAGTAEALPVPDVSVDLVWCRDVLVHVRDLDRAYAEFRRVLRPGGRVLLYQMFGTDRLEPQEAAWLWSTMGVVPPSADPARAEAAMAAAGLRVDSRIDLGPEWGEYAEEAAGDGSRRLLRAARLLRDPDRYTARFGRRAYDVMLGDCLWHVYRMIGKLSPRIYLLSADRQGRPGP